MTNRYFPDGFGAIGSPSKHPSTGDFAEGCRSDEFWTHALIEDRLIEAAALWRRTPAGRDTGPMKLIARDGPWGRILPEWEDWGAHEEKPLRPLALDRAEVARRDEASGWIERHVDDEVRGLVWAVVFIKADDRRPDWIAIARGEGLRPRDSERLRKRYSRAIERVAAALNGMKVPVLAARI